MTDTPLHYRPITELAALLRSGRPLDAFELFEVHLEGGGASGVGSLHAAEWNVEHTLSLLTKALSKRMSGRRAYRVYSLARSSGLLPLPRRLRCERGPPQSSVAQISILT